MHDILDAIPTLFLIYVVITAALFVVIFTDHIVPVAILVTVPVR
jgi:hypothetical protein